MVPFLCIPRLLCPARAALAEAQAQLRAEREEARQRVQEGGAEARMGGAKGRLAHSRKKGELVGEEAFMSGYMAKGSGAKCDIFAVGAQTVKVAVIAREQLNELNMIHPILVFKLIFYAGTVVLGQIKGQLEQLGVTIDDDVNAGSFLQGVMHMLHLSQTEYMRRGDMGAVAGPKRGRKARALRAASSAAGLKSFAGRARKSRQEITEMYCAVA